MSRTLHGWSAFVCHAFVVLGIVFGTAGPATGAGTQIPEGDLNQLSFPCQLSVAESPSSRVLTWASVGGAVTYKVGFIRGAEIVGLAETANTTYTHSGFDPEACLRYVVVAYDGTALKVCAAATLAGKCP